jgi:uncharacterized protein YkwD
MAPRPVNRPGVWRVERRMKTRLAAFFFVTVVAAPLSAPAQDTAEVSREMVDRSNAFRREQGLAPLQPQRALTQAAGAFAAHMAQTDRYGHDADGRTPVQRTQAEGYAHCMVAENIAMQYDSRGFSGGALARGFVQGWIDSPGHRENLLSAEATDIGLAVARSPASGRWYAVQVFGRPMSRAVRFEISNRSKVALRYSLDDKAYALLPGVTRTHQHCSPPQLTLGLPGQAQPVRLRPANGAQLRVEPTPQGLRLVPVGGAGP